MTSISNHQQTVNYFKKAEFFDLPPEKVKIFSQGELPVFDESGKIFWKASAALPQAQWTRRRFSGPKTVSIN